MVRSGLHLDTQLVLVKLGWEGPVERRQGVGPKHVFGSEDHTSGKDDAETWVRLY